MCCFWILYLYMCSSMLFLVECYVLRHLVYIQVIMINLIICSNDNLKKKINRGGISRGRGGDSRRFLYYVLYAFGCPILITTIVYLIDIFQLVPEGFLPNIGKRRCWMQDKRVVEAIYVYFPISIIMITNIILYSITAYKIWVVQKETSVVRRGDSQKHAKLEADTDR